MANAGCQLELQRLKRNHKPPALLQQQRDSSGGGRQQSLQEVAGGAGGAGGSLGTTQLHRITSHYSWTLTLLHQEILGNLNETIWIQYLCKQHNKSGVSNDPELPSGGGSVPS